MVGSIDGGYSEHDPAIVRRDDGSYLVDGLLPIADLLQQPDLAALAVDPRQRDFETVAGFALALFGRIPSAGDSVEWLGYWLEIVDMDGRRIDKLLIQPPQA